MPAKDAASCPDGWLTRDPEYLLESICSESDNIFCQIRGLLDKIDAFTLSLRRLTQAQRKKYSPLDISALLLGAKTLDNEWTSALCQAESLDSLLDDLKRQFLIETADK